jgi:hypothetical protein
MKEVAVARFTARDQHVAAWFTIRATALQTEDLKLGPAETAPVADVYQQQQILDVYRPQQIPEEHKHKTIITTGPGEVTELPLLRTQTVRGATVPVTVAEAIPAGAMAIRQRHLPGHLTMAVIQEAGAVIAEAVHIPVPVQVQVAVVEERVAETNQ